MGYEGIIVCEKCGSKFELYKAKLIVRDKDSEPCDVCGNTLIDWSGAVIYRTKLIEKHENHKRE